MDKTTLILVMVALLVLFIALVSLYVWSGRTKKATVPNSQEEAVTFEMMRAVIGKNASTNMQINHAVDTIIERYGHIDDYGVYAELLEKLCVHPATDSKVILRFQKGLITANPNYKERIEKTLKLGLEGRK